MALSLVVICTNCFNYRIILQNYMKTIFVRHEPHQCEVTFFDQLRARVDLKANAGYGNFQVMALCKPTAIKLAWSKKVELTQYYLYLRTLADSSLRNYLKPSCNYLLKGVQVQVLFGGQVWQPSTLQMTSNLKFTKFIYRLVVPDYLSYPNP